MEKNEQPQNSSNNIANQSTASTTSFFLKCPTRKYLDTTADVNEIQGIVKLQTNLFNIKTNNDLCEGVYLYGIYAQEIFPKTIEDFPVSLMREVKNVRSFKEYLKERFHWFYISGLLLFAKKKPTTVDREFSIYILIQTVNDTKEYTLYHDNPLQNQNFNNNNNNGKVYKFTFTERHNINECNSNECSTGEAQLFRNYINVIIGKLMNRIGYTKDSTTRKILYYSVDKYKQAERIRNSHSVLSGELFFFPAIKAVSDAYVNGKVYLKILPKNILKSNYTYYDYFENIMNTVEGSDESKWNFFVERVLRQGRGIKIYNSKSEKIEEVIYENPYNIKFQNSNGKDITVGEYYRMQYNRSLLDKEQPIAVRYFDKGGKINRAQAQRIYIPCQFLQIVGNIDEQKIDMKQLIEPPYIKHEKIHQVRASLENVYYNITHNNNNNNNEQQNNQQMENCIDFSSLKPVEVTGYVLKDPEIKFKDDKKEIRSDEGRFDLVNNKPCKKIPDLELIEIFLIGLDMEHGGLIYSKLLEAASSLGIELPESPSVTTIDITKYKQILPQLLSEFKQQVSEKKRPNPKLIFFFLPRKDPAMYSFIKNTLNNSELKTPSQVIVYNEKKMNSPNLSLFTNVLAQIWGKHGIEFFSVDFDFVKDTIVMAYSVMKYKDNKSITSLCISYTKTKVEYVFYSEISEQNNRVSPVIAKMVENAIKHIWHYQKHTVKNIIVYREGANDKALRAIKEFELPDFIKGIQKSINDIQAEKLDNDKNKEKKEKAKKYWKDPKLCFIVVNKINEIKFFKVNNNNNQYQSNSNISNVDIGTVVDHTVVSSENWDFHLNSAFSLKGMSNMTHYNILYNETSGLKASTIYKLTYFLTFLCYNTTKSIKIPAPLYFVIRRNQFTKATLEKEINNSLRLYNISL